MRSFRLLFLVLFLSIPSIQKAHAQSFFSGNCIEGGVVVGSHALGGPGGALQDKVYGFDLSYHKNISHISDKWVGMTGARSIGMGLVFRDLQYLKGYRDTSASSMGQAYGLAGQVDFRLLKSGGSTLTLKPGVGLSYLTKTFFTDKRNRFIGSHLNQMIKADLLLRIPLNSLADLTAGAGFLHYSNGGYNIPNSGLNMLSLSTGLRFKSGDVQKTEYQTRFEQLKKNTFEVNLGIGRRGVYESKDGLMKSGIYAGYNFYINEVISLKSGFDAVYYYTPFNPAPDRALQTFQYYGTSFDKWRTGLTLGGEATLWRFALNGQLGKYLHYNSYYENINWFWNTGLVFYASPNIGIQAKTYFHKSQADFINYGLVFKI